MTRTPNAIGNRYKESSLVASSHASVPLARLETSMAQRRLPLKWSSTLDRSGDTIAKGATVSAR
jgi:hypothetical protein